MPEKRTSVGTERIHFLFFFSSSGNFQHFARLRISGPGLNFGHGRPFSFCSLHIQFPCDNNGTLLPAHIISTLTYLLLYFVQHDIISSVLLDSSLKYVLLISYNKVWFIYTRPRNKESMCSAFHTRYSESTRSPKASTLLRSARLKGSSDAWGGGLLGNQSFTQYFTTFGVVWPFHIFVCHCYSDTHTVLE